MRYRADIDGLRAVAVLPVIAFHMGITRMSGGFIGVDVFFVISGFLIGSLILHDMDAGRFSLGRFYERRIRRIMPALIVMLLVTAAAGSFLLFARPFYEFGQSLLAAAFSVSNFYFWQTGGYFGLPTDSKPLLHTWSLGVEDQFYLLFPPFLLLARRFFKNHLTTALAVTAAISFAISVPGAWMARTASFYLLPARAWELLMGGLLASRPLPEIRSSWIRNGVALAGLALIAVPVFIYRKSTPFPGLTAVPPCLGAAMIIATGSQAGTLVSRILSWRPAVFIGLISYSLYLWHWPVIVLLRQYLLRANFSSLMRAEVFLLSLGLAILSWRFVEQPCRRKAAPRAKVFTAAAVAVAAAAAVALAVIALGGMPGRFPPRIAQLASYMDYPIDSYRTGTCYINSSYQFSDYKPGSCLNESAAVPNIVLAGDSHAADLWYGLDKTLTGEHVMQATSSGCRPTLNRFPFEAPYCAQLMDYLYRQYLPSHKISLLILSGLWESWDVQPIGDTIDWARKRNIPVVLVGPVVDYEWPVPQLLAMSVERNDPGLPGRHIITHREMDRRLADLAAQKQARYASSWQALCPDGRCTEYGAGGVPVEWDAAGHLTKEGSVLMAQRFQAAGIFNVAK